MHELLGFIETYRKFIDVDEETPPYAAGIQIEEIQFGKDVRRL